MNRIVLTLLAVGLLGFTACTSAYRGQPISGAQPVESIAATSGTPQSHAVNGGFGAALVATVTTDGVPTSGITVTFTAPATGASATFSNTSSLSATAVTDINGVAISPAVTANGTAGSYVVTAAVEGVPSPANFNLTNTTGSPATISATSGTPQSAPVNAVFAAPLVATVVDSGQNPVSGAIVVFTAPATGASGTFANATITETDTTNASGVATSSAFTANGFSGAYSITATTSGAPAPANFNLTNSGGAPVTIVATGGTPQVATISTAFAAPLVATVLDASSNPVGGVAVTFTAPASGASGAFANATVTETDVTNSSGMATSTTFVANATVGGPYTVTATFAGAASPASFTLSNRAVTTGTTTFVFSLAGQELNGPDFYALAGAVQIDANGNVLAGVQDYNDAGFGHASPEPGGDAITAGTLTVNATTGQGTLTLTTNNTALGVNGVETLGVQFVNSNHAMIMEFDGTASANGSLDLQTLPSSLSGGFAFVLAGLDGNLGAVEFGGVFSVASGTLQAGLVDVNDNGAVTTGTALTGNVSNPDSFGRGTITSSLNFGGTPIALNYYVVGPKAIRIIDVDLSDSALGSAFSQGTRSFSNASVGTSVLAMAGSPYPTNFAVAGMFSTSNTSSSVADFSGVADVNEVNFGLQLQASPLSGTYSIASNGYGNLTIVPGSLSDASLLGVYLTDPTLNLIDPNNTASGLGGALVADLDAALAGGSGLLIPQTDASSSSFTGNYAVTAQAFNDSCCEFDFVGQATKTGSTLNGTVLLSDPFLTLSGATATNSGATLSAAPLADPGNIGRYTLFSTNPTPNPLTLTVNSQSTGLDVVLYQASGGELFWIDGGSANVFLGSLQQQGSLSGLLGTGRGSAASIAATSGTPQSTTINTSFPAPLGATVTTGGVPTSGVVVTFTAPASGASGSFADTGTNTTTVTSDASGVAASPAFTANGTSGTYTVTAAAAGVSTPASFSLTNSGGSAELIVATSGTPQSAVINTVFAAPLVATVTSGGLPVSGVTVLFTAPLTGPSGIFADSSANSTTASTNASGIATSALFTANGTSGSYTVTAAPVGGSALANFSLTNTPAVTEIIVATSGSPQSAVVNTAFAAPLVATVTVGGSPASGVAVTFTAPSSGAGAIFAGSNTNTATATTNSSGVATSPALTANSVSGSYGVTASAAGAAAPASFSLTNSPSSPATIAATSGTPQSAVIHTAFALPLVATVLDSGSHPVSGVTVTFTAPATGASGTFAGSSTNTTTATTNSSGVATSAIFTANGTTGAYTATGSVSGVSTAAIFNLTNAPDVPASISATSGTPQSTAINTAFAAPLVATVLDSGSHPVSGVSVTFTAPATGASGTFAGTNTNTTTATTNSSGVATSSTFTANATAGSYIVAASVSGVSTPANFSLTNAAAVPATITATSGTPQTATVESAFSAPLVATVLDSGSHPVSGVVVTFTAPASGASGTFADSSTNTTTATTNASGVATSPVFTANATAGSYTVTASVAGVSTPADFSLTNAARVPATISATSGTPQSAAISTAFASPLAATVLDSGSHPVSGVVVTFTAPASGASGTFADTHTRTTTATTNASGIATSTTFTANATAGAYLVAATVSGVATPANFSLTNTPPPATTFVFSLSGQEANGPDFYALAGAVQIDANGNVVDGVQDYNDAGFGHASPEPGGDAITAGTLTVNATTGQGTLTLTTNNTALGVNGVETLGVQFVNSKHAMIMEFDETATSNGSLDLQTLPSSLSGGFAFTLAGLDSNLGAVEFGGVFSVASGTMHSGLVDINDNGAVTTGTALTGNVSNPDSFGRGTISSSLNFGGTPIALNYYVVGPKAIRIIDVDLSDSALGSAFSQGTGSFSNASVGTSVLAMAGSPYPTNFAVAGMFSTSNTSSSVADFSGVADDNEVNFGVQVAASSISGNYSVAADGYGSLTVSSASLGDVSLLGLYLTDPTLNLIDPNNTASGLGGALVADLDAALAGGTGMLVPQTDSAASSFTGTYAFSAQAFNDLCCEFDFVGQATMSSGVFSGTGLLGDPFLTLSGAAASNTGVGYSGKPLADLSNVGRYTLLSTNSTPNPFHIKVNTSVTSLDVVIYQASGGQLFWLNQDAGSVFLGSLEKQGSLTRLPKVTNPLPNPESR